MTPQSRLIERITSNFVQTGADRPDRVSGGQYDLWMRVWVDLTNTAHVLVLRPLVELLERAGPRGRADRAAALAHARAARRLGPPLHALGHHGGAGRPARRSPPPRASRQLLALRPRPGLRLRARARLDRPAARRAALLRIPNTTMFDYEWASLQHHVNCRLANRVLVPDAIPAERLARYGARPPKLVQYPGLKEEYYLVRLRARRARCSSSSASTATARSASSAPRRRTRSTWAAPRARCCRGCCERLAEDEDAQTVVLARNDEQRARGRRRSSLERDRPERAVDGRSLVAFADLLVSAGGTMNREAAVLGTPVWSIFEGKLGRGRRAARRARAACGS